MQKNRRPLGVESLEQRAMMTATPLESGLANVSSEVAQYQEDIQLRIVDAFTESKFDATKWDIDASASAEARVLAINGIAELRYGGLLISRDPVAAGPDGTVRITASFKPNGLSVQTIFLRGSHTGDGVWCVVPVQGNLQIFERLDGQTQLLAQTPWSMRVGKRMEVTVTDDGSIVTCRVDSDGTAIAQASSAARNSDQRIAFRTNGLVELDDIRAQETIRVPVEAHDAVFRQIGQQGISALDSASATSRLDRLSDPELHIARIAGPNVTVQVHSPHDSSRVAIDGGGLLSQAVADHEGGTTGTLATVTFRADNKPGVYTMHLTDADSGRRLDTVQLQWNGTALSLLNNADAWSIESYSEHIAAQIVLEPTGDLGGDIQRELQLEALHVLAEQKMAANLAAQTAVETFSTSSSVVRANMMGDLWGRSGLALTTMQAEQLFYQKNPQYKEENLHATIDAEMLARPGYSRASVQNMVLSRRQDLLARVHRGANGFNADMQNIIFPAALQVMEGVRRGEPEQPLINAFNGTLGSLQGHRIAELVLYTGFNTPGGGTILEAAKRALFNETDLVAYYQGEDDRLLSMAQREIDRKIEAQWVAALEDSQRLQWSGEPSTVTREQALANQERWIADLQVIRAEQRIAASQAETNRAQDRAARLVASALSAATDARVQVVLAETGQTNVQRERQEGVDLLYVQLSTQQAEQIDQGLQAVLLQGDLFDAEARAQEYVLSQATTIYVEIADTEVPAEDLSAFRAELARRPTAKIYKETQTWFNASQPSPSLPGEHIRTDSAAGRLFLGLAQQLIQAGDRETQLRLAVRAEAVTDIPAEKILAAISGRGNVSLAALRSTFEQAGFMQIVLPQAPGTLHAPRILSTNTALPDVHGREGMVRIRFDAVDQQQIVNRVQVFRVDGPKTVLAVARNQLFVDVPMEKIAQSGDVQLKIVVHFAGGKKAEAKTDWFTLRTTGQNEQIAEGKLHDAIRERIAGQFPLEGSPTEWRQVIASTLHAGENFHAVDLNAGSGDADYGRKIYALDDGEIIDVQEKYGTIRIRHELGGRNWESVILHVPIKSTNRTDSEGDPVFEVVDARTDIVIRELSIGTKVQRAETVGIVGGQSDKAKPYASHLHLEVEANGEGIDLRTTLNGWGIKIFTADDYGTKGEVRVQWNSDLNAWLNDEYKIVFDRSAQQIGQVAGVWKAWEKNKKMSDLSVVKWDIPEQGWFQVDGLQHRWDANLQSFVEPIL